MLLAEFHSFYSRDKFIRILKRQVDRKSFADRSLSRTLTVIYFSSIIIIIIIIIYIIIIFRSGYRIYMQRVDKWNFYLTPSTADGDKGYKKFIKEYKVKVERGVFDFDQRFLKSFALRSLSISNVLPTPLVSHWNICIHNVVNKYSIDFRVIFTFSDAVAGF